MQQHYHQLCASRGFTFYKKTSHFHAAKNKKAILTPRTPHRSLLKRRFCTFKVLPPFLSTFYQRKACYEIRFNKGKFSGRSKRTTINGELNNPTVNERELLQTEI